MLLAISADCAQLRDVANDTFRSRAATRPEVSAIAELSDRVLNAMTNEELTAVIQAADHLLPQSIRDRGRVALKDRATLVRIACLARRACRNRRSVH